MVVLLILRTKLKFRFLVFTAGLTLEKQSSDSLQLACDIKQAKNSLDVLSEVFQLTSDFSHISAIITLPDALVPAFQCVGSLRVLIGNFRPDSKHEEILGFKELSKKIDLVRNDIKDLENLIRSELAELQYANAVNRIESGVEYFHDIRNVSDASERLIYQKSLCANENCALSVKALLDGLTRGGLFASSILDKLYDRTGGTRPRISALATRVLRLVCGGIMVISPYETMMHGVNEAALITEGLYRRLNEARFKVQSTLDRCQNDFRGNMLNDLNRYLGAGGSNEALVTKISEFMRVKYDWL